MPLARGSAAAKRRSVNALRPATDRLHAIDAVWLEMEGSGPPIAIGVVAVAEGPPPGDAEVIQMLAERLPTMSGLRQRLVPDPTRLRRAARVEAEHVDLAAHVHRVPARTSPAHGGLDGAVGSIMEQRLPPGQPLWDLWVVEGLDGQPHGRWAVVWRIHHTITDGLGAIALFRRAFDVTPDGELSMSDAVRSATEQPAARRDDRTPERRRGAVRPSGVDLRHAFGTVTSVAAHLPSVLATLVPQVPTSLTAAVGDRRTWCSADVPLSQVEAVRRAYGVTVNDVALAAVAGGFRDLLLNRGERVDHRGVRNLVPVSMRPTGESRAGNLVSGLLGNLPVGVADPVARLRAVRAAVTHGKEGHAAALFSLWLDVVDHTVPSFVQDVAVRAAGRWAPSWFFDTLTTNVPGPAFPVYLLGRRVTRMYPLIPVAGRTPIITGIISYDGRLNIGVTGASGPAGDVRVLARGIRRCVGELAERGSRELVP